MRDITRCVPKLDNFEFFWAFPQSCVVMFKDAVPVKWIYLSENSQNAAEVVATKFVQSFENSHAA